MKEDILKYYVDTFNSDDNELYKNAVDNSCAYEWLKEEIPIFTCPDKDIERTYYFRWWTYRKHLKNTPEGYVITEFLPDVPWAGKYNTIVAPFGFHLYEGRWLKNADRYLADYTRIMLAQPNGSHSYSVWFADAVVKLVEVTGNTDFAKEIFDALCEHYSVWEKTQMLENGMLCSIDDRDAMEFSISGTNESLKWMWGIRPTLNSYVCADALAISRLAALIGNAEAEQKYKEKHNALRKLINEKLYRDGFYRAFHNEDKAALNNNIFNNEHLPPRELLGYIPWMFNIPTDEQKEHFELLSDENSFYTEYGPATAERSHPRFLYEMKHDCLWNGYVWPFATSQTLYALKNAIDNYGCEKYKKLYCDMLKQFAASHTRICEDGKTVCWIDESRHPIKDVWYTRDCLEKADWPSDLVERGKDYNHSSFCDLVIGGIVGVNPLFDGSLEIKPNIPEDWEYFSLSNLHINGKCYDISYNRQSGLSIKQK